MEPFYTLVCEFDGGTYVSQFNAIDELHAVTIWAREFSKEKDVAKRSADVANAIKVAVSEGEGLVRLDGLVNAWCVTASLMDELILLNVIKTSRD